MSKKSNKSKLYYEILQIGAEHLEEGITLNELKQRLKSDDKKFDSYINTIFLNNFSPIDSKVESFGTITTWDLSSERIERANENKYRIDVTSLSEYLKLKHSINNLKGARISRCISLIALVTSLGILSIGVYNIKKSKQTNIEIKNKLDSILLSSQVSNANDSLLLNMVILRDSIDLNNLNYDSLTNTVLHSINWKLYQIRKEIEKIENE